MPDSGLTPPLFSINPPYEKMNGTKILVQTSLGQTIGDLIAYHQKGKFGIRIDILHPPVYHPRTAPIPESQWVEVGYIPVTVVKLTEKQILSIKKIDHQDYTYAVQIDEISK
jgi:hypothetical protein